MRRLRTIVRVLFLLAVLGSLPVLLFGVTSSREEAVQAEARYVRMAEYLDVSTHRLRDAESRLERLTTRVEAVEHEVRSQLQMVKPGETLYLVEKQ